MRSRGWSKLKSKRLHALRKKRQRSPLRSNRLKESDWPSLRLSGLSKRSRKGKRQSRLRKKKSRRDSRLSASLSKNNS